MNNFDFSWWDVVNSLGSMLLALILWLRRPAEEAGQEVGKLREAVMRELRTMGDRISKEVSDLRNVQDKLEERIRHMPSHNEVSELSGDIKAIDERTKGLAEGLGSVRAQLQWLQDFLVKQGK